MRAIVLLLAMAALPVRAEAPWQRDLFLGLDDCWRARVAIELRNGQAVELQGRPVGVPVGPGGLAALIGARARDLRVCDEAGAELLFDLRDAAGARQTDGLVAAGSSLLVPGTMPASGRQRLYVYFDHPGTYPVPDYLRGATALSNAGFESGTGAAPAQWQLDAGDDHHQLSWVTERPHGGQRCLKCVVAPGAERTWIGARQGNLSVRGGARYRLTVWVRGEKVSGQAGWFVHVATPANSQAVNKVFGREGSFDWTQVACEFTTPSDAVGLTCGSVLWGSGTAWYDDLKLECLDTAAEVVTWQVGAVERLNLASVAAPARPNEAGQWDVRVPVKLVNPGEAIPGALVQVPVGSLAVKLRGDWSLRSLRAVAPNGRTLPTLRAGSNLVFVADVPARSAVEFALFISRDAALPAGPALSYADLVNHPANLARNPSFEEGEQQPTAWPGAVEGKSDSVPTMRRVEGGPVGRWCAKLAVPPTAPLAWVGWRQKVPVTPGESYFYSCQVKTERITDGGVTIHGHFQDAEGKLSGAKFWGAGGNLSGDQDWQPVSGVATMSGDTRQFELHLTMNARGTVYHDGVVFMRTVVAGLGPLRDAGPVRPLAVWAENPLVKVFRDSAPRRVGELAVATPRNGAECLQLCVRPAAKAAVKLTVGPLRAGDRTLPAPRVERVGYVPCLQAGGYYTSPAQPWERRKIGPLGRTDGWRDWWPDYLAPVGETTEVAAGTTQPFWLTVAAPKDAAPGEYRGQVTVQAGAETVTLPLTVRVWSLVLPERPSLQVICDVRNGTAHHDVRSRADHERWWRFMAQRHISPDNTLAQPKFSLVDGQVKMDTTDYDRDATLLFDELKVSAGYFPPIFYSCGWAHPPREFLGLKYPSPEFKAAYQSAVRQFWAHVKAKGWADRLSLYISDEPHYSRPEVVKWLGEVIDFVRQVDPKIPVYSSTWGFVPQWEGRLNHWGIAQYGLFPMDVAKRRGAAGDKLWFTVDGQMEIDTPYNACERLLPYYCFAHGMTGWEFWGISWYTYDPFQYGWHEFIHQSDTPGQWYWVRYPNGDGYIAYPGEPLGLPGPLSTVRLEQARQGVEDYELLTALERRGGRQPEVRKLLDEVRALAFIPNAGGYRATDILPDPDRLAALRLRVGDALETLR